ncbi:MAG: 30S ribosomal protein S18 [Clostridiales bacterium]|jgi:small subunit ribosomal protein S18|nr:30S ribosomal protein S18 [Clostridiales bacterium]MCR4670229.1 30S ribosomal protein S18 [Saccharofermentans sp.]
MAENKAPKTGREFSGNRQRRSRRKVCQFCANKTAIDFMDGETLKKYVSENGKILPRRMTGTCAIHQRELTTAIKRARQVAVLPFTVR